jgi:DNA-directed RNA polymerase specialized sigma24 family protein
LIDLNRRYRDRDRQAPSRLLMNVAAPAHLDLDFWTDCHEAVARLPEKLREVTALTLYAGLPQAEVASCVGMSVRTVQRRLGEAVGQMRRDLREEPTTPAEAGAP